MSRYAAGNAVIWSAVDLVGRQGISFVVSVILARLLTPADFGAVALAAFFASLIIAAVQSASATTIIQRQQATDTEVSSIFWWNLAISAALAALVVLISPWIAQFFRLPVLKPLLLAAGAQVVLASFGTIPSALLSRELQFAAIAKASIPATLASGLIGIGLALSGFGVWALAGQLVTSAALISAAVWTVSGWRPGLHLRATGLPDAFRFARWLSFSAALEVAYSQGFALVLGRLYGPSDLGLYGRAASTQQVPATVISGVIARVALPLLAPHKDNPEALARGLLAANRTAMVVSLPTLVALALTADLVIRVLFGPKWNDAAPVLAILAWAGALFPLHANNLQVLLASGRSETYFRVEIAKKVVGVIALLIGSFFGIMGLAWSQLAFSIIALAINLWPVGRLLGCGLVAQLVDLNRTIASTALMTVAILATRVLFVFSPAAELSMIAIVGAVTYAIAELLLRDAAASELIQIARVQLRKRSAV